MAKFLKSAKSFQEFPFSDKEVIFIGKSNVGKSSLINALYGKSTAYVGKTPGKTKMLNFFETNEGYTFVDAPGYGYAQRSDREIVEFGEMMEDYFTKREALRLAVLIIDCRHKPTKDDIEMKEYLDHFGKPYVILVNKIDKLSNNELFKQKKVIREALNCSDDQLIYASAFKKTNIEKVKEVLQLYLV